MHTKSFSHVSVAIIIHSFAKMLIIRLTSMFQKVWLPFIMAPQSVFITGCNRGNSKWNLFSKNFSFIFPPPIPPSPLTSSSSSKALGSNWWNSSWPFPPHLATSLPHTGARRGQVRAQHFISRHILQNLIWKPEILIMRHMSKERTGEGTFANNCLQFL